MIKMTHVALATALALVLWTISPALAEDTPADETVTTETDSAAPPADESSEPDEAPEE